MNPMIAFSACQNSCVHSFIAWLLCLSFSLHPVPPPGRPHLPSNQGRPAAEELAASQVSARRLRADQDAVLLLYGADARRAAECKWDERNGEC